MIWPEAKKAQFNIPFTLVIKDRRRSKVTDSPAPFRCTIGEFYGPAAWLIHSMTKERGSWLCFSYDKIRRAIYCREKRDRLELPGRTRAQNLDFIILLMIFIFFLFLLFVKLLDFEGLTFFKRTFFLRKKDHLSYILLHIWLITQVLVWRKLNIGLVCKRNRVGR